ncbi:hypothetical protein HanRHA438_Chr07g0326511 [Helianthus annuus]|nr:hypothetical protein HanRHA438_Chr07g0326511 [Helianthus annuus]
MIVILSQEIIIIMLTWINYRSKGAPTMLENQSSNDSKSICPRVHCLASFTFH